MTESHEIKIVMIPDKNGILIKAWSLCPTK